MKKLMIAVVLLMSLANIAYAGTRPLPVDNPPPPAPTATPLPPAATPIPTPITPVITPFPTGSNVTLEPGLYGCPSSIVAGMRIVGHGSIVSPEMATDTAFAPLPPPAPVVRIICTSNLTLTDLTDVAISGVIFDFKNTGGLILDTTAWSRFDIGIVNALTALTVQSRDGNNAGNTFSRVVIYEAQRGILLQGLQNSQGTFTGVTWNDFYHVDAVRIHDYAINISQFADSNTFHSVRINAYPNAYGVIFNDNGVLADVDASGNKFDFVNCDGTITCVDFRGYTVGNHVTVGFGIMPDSNKVRFANSFSQLANTVVKLQETPKIP